MPNPTAQAQQQPTPTPWPDGVIARYLTVGGATVDLSHDVFYLHDTEPSVTVARCGGCPANAAEKWAEYADRLSNGSTWADEEARKWAQAHAEKCRALPRPAVTA